MLGGLGVRVGGQGQGWGWGSELGVRVMYHVDESPHKDSSTGIRGCTDDAGMEGCKSSRFKKRRRRRRRAQG